MHAQIETESATLDHITFSEEQPPSEDKAVFQPRQN